MTESVNPTLRSVPISAVRPSPANPWRSVGDIDELGASIQAVGIVEPLVVTGSEAGGYELIAGERRLAAARKAGLAEVPVIIREASEAERIEMMLIENCQRAGLAPTEEAEAYRALIEAHGFTQRALAARLGRSQSHIAKRLGLLGLPDPMRSEVDSGGISVADGLELVKLAAAPERLEAARSNARLYGGIAAAVRIQLGDLAREKRRRQKMEELASEGIAVLAWPEHGFWDSVSSRPLERRGYAGLDLDPKAHATEPCHGAAVSPGGEVVWVCTEPGRHRGPDEQRAKAGALSEQERARWAEERAHHEALAATTAPRRRHLVDLLARPTSNQAQVTEHLAWTLLEDTESWEHCELACELVGIKAERGDEGWDPSEALRSFASAGAGEAARAGLALAFALAEDTIGGWGTASSQVALRHLRYLRHGGYRLSDAEAEELERLSRQGREDDRCW